MSNSISISQLKTNPSVAFTMAKEAPLVILRRNKVAGYLVSPEIYDALVQYIENHTDREAIESAKDEKHIELEELLEELDL